MSNVGILLLVPSLYCTYAYVAYVIILTIPIIPITIVNENLVARHQGGMVVGQVTMYTVISCKSQKIEVAD